MTEYVVINTKTRELMSTNGVIRTFFSYHSARVERDQRNDDAKKTYGFSYAESGVRVRCYDWQVCLVPKGIRTESIEVEREVAPFCFEKQTLIRYSVDKNEAITPITRAPRTNTKNARMMAAIERSQFSAQIKKTPCRIRKKK